MRKLQPDKSQQLLAFPLAAIASALVACALLPATINAELTSRDAPELARVLRENAETDKNKDGILSFDEYDAFYRTQGEKKPANPISMAVNNGNLLITDFEENNLGRMTHWGWKIQGSAFRHDLNQATRTMQRRAGTFSGRYLVTSFDKSDAPTGRLLSPDFKIAQPHLSLLVSGGRFPGKVCVNLRVDGEIVRSVTGRNDDHLEHVAFNVEEFLGKPAQLEIVDSHRGLWGHINVDRIFQTMHPGTARVISERPKDAVKEAWDGKSFVLLKENNERLNGVGEISDGMLQAGTRPVGGRDFLIAVRDVEAGPGARSNKEAALRMKNGEVWMVRSLAFEKGKLTIQSELFGKREIALDKVASLEFKDGGADMDEAGEPGNLYRTEGDPVPGKLIWVRDKDIAIDCALGIVPLPREKVRSFVLPLAKGESRTAAKRPGGDEISLSDGTLLFGKFSFQEQGLSLEHAEFEKGQRTIPWSSVRHVRRSEEGLSWLDLLESKIVDRRGPALPPPAPELLASPGTGHLRAIRMMPRTVVTYTVPASGSSGKRRFRAQLAPLEGGRADLSVRLLASENELLWERKIAAGAKPIPVSVELPGSGAGEIKLTIEIDFAGSLAFPCGVDWRDAHVIASGQAGEHINPDKPTKTD